MELSILERLLLLNVLPREGDLTTIKIVRQLREDLSFDEAENAALKFRQGDPARGENPSMMMWVQDAIPDIEIEIGPKGMELVRKTLEEMDAAKKLTEQHLGLCEKFGIGSVT